MPTELIALRSRSETNSNSEIVKIKWVSAQSPTSMTANSTVPQKTDRETNGGSGTDNGKLNCLSSENPTSSCVKKCVRRISTEKTIVISDKIGKDFGPILS